MSSEWFLRVLHVCFFFDLRFLAFLFTTVGLSVLFFRCLTVQLQSCNILIKILLMFLFMYACVLQHSRKKLTPKRRTLSISGIILKVSVLYFYF